MLKLVTLKSTPQITRVSIQCDFSRIGPFYTSKVSLVEHIINQQTSPSDFGDHFCQEISFSAVQGPGLLYHIKLLPYILVAQ